MDLKLFIRIIMRRVTCFRVCFIRLKDVLGDYTVFGYQRKSGLPKRIGCEESGMSRTMVNLFVGGDDPV